MQVAIPPRPIPYRLRRLRALTADLWAEVPEARRAELFAAGDLRGDLTIAPYYRTAVVRTVVLS